MSMLPMLPSEGPPLPIKLGITWRRKRPGLKEYGVRLMEARWCYDELDTIAKEWGEPTPPKDYNIILMKKVSGMAVRLEDEMLLEKYSAQLKEWPRYEDYKYLKRFCDALFDFKTMKLATGILNLYFGER